MPQNPKSRSLKQAESVRQVATKRTGNTVLAGSKMIVEDLILIVYQDV